MLACNCFHTLHTSLCYSFDIVQELCDLAISSDTSVSNIILNYLDLISELKLDTLFRVYGFDWQCFFKSEV